MRFIITNRAVPGYFLSFLLLILELPISLSGQETDQGSFQEIFQAGAASSNITPKIGSSVNGGFQDRQAMNIHDETHAWGLILDDGRKTGRQ